MPPLRDSATQLRHSCRGVPPGSLHHFQSALGLLLASYGQQQLLDELVLSCALPGLPVVQ